MGERRRRGTGTVFFRDGGWIALAPQHKRGEKQFRVAKEPTRRQAARALDAWLNREGRIVRHEQSAEKRARRTIA